MSSSEQGYPVTGVARSTSASPRDAAPAGPAGGFGLGDVDTDAQPYGSAARRPAGTTTGARPSGTLAPGAARRVRLTVARVDPWSVMKLSFLLSVAIGVALVVAAGVLWTILDGMGLFSDINGVVGEVMADPSFDVMDYIGFGKVLSLATVIAVVDVVLLTALATLGAFLYNIASSLVGGLHLTLSDD